MYSMYTLNIFSVFHVLNVFNKKSCLEIIFQIKSNMLTGKLLTGQLCYVINKFIIKVMRSNTNQM